MTRIERALRDDAAVYAACAVTLALGLFFVFGWAPHPWTWEGFDHYHELALTLAAGAPFPTMDVPWGYAYFAAVWYRIAGDRPWVVLLVQVILNASVPWLVYRFARSWTDRTTAIVAAVLTGVFSFNTIYASTQSSDAVCTVLFMAAVVVFVTALRRQRWTDFAAVGALTGLAAQFRPNLILIPLLLAGYAVFDAPTRRRMSHAAALLLVAAAALTPWVVRNYRLTHLILPTSVHGGVQLWYGTLQVGPYLHSRAYNPRAAFETPVFDSTSLDAVPLIVAARANPCTERPPDSVDLVYWTDINAARHRVAAVPNRDGRIRFELPPPRPATAVYYYFDAQWRRDPAVATTTPPEGDAAPLVYFVSHDHLGDLDVHGDLLDVFDLVRLARHRAWGEPIAFEAALARARVGAGDLERAASVLARAAGDRGPAQTIVSSVEHDERQVRLTLHDGSTIAIPRVWSGRITDVTFSGTLALKLMTANASIAALEQAAIEPPPAREILCAQLTELAVNREFHRREPHLMGRYSALAFDNIRRDPGGFMAASIYRALRVFVIEGTSDRHTAQQFSLSGLIYRLATIATLAYVVLSAAGAALAWRRGDAVLLPILLVVYVPLTIAPVLTNMRYSVTVQPIIFIFIAAAVTDLAARAGLLARPPAEPGPAGRRTVPEL
jgi:hypothetical protein